MVHQAISAFVLLEKSCLSITNDIYRVVSENDPVKPLYNHANQKATAKAQIKRQDF